MAKNFSINEANKAFINFYGRFFPLKNDKKILVIIRILFMKYHSIKWDIFNLKQKIFKFFYELLKKNKNTKINLNFKISSIVNKDQKTYEDLNNKGFTFIEDFFDDKTYMALKENFPKFYNFRHSKNPIKSYYHSYIYDPVKKKTTIPDENTNFAYNKLFNYLKSNEFEDCFNKFLDNKNHPKEKFKFFSFNLTIKKYKSYLIPHQDGIVDKNFDNYNFIYFLEGNNSDIKFSAGTGIYEDNEFKKPLLIPANLNNGCLLYKSSNTHDFFHGFDIVKKDCFAKVFTFEMNNYELFNKLNIK